MNLYNNARFGSLSNMNMFRHNIWHIIYSIKNVADKIQDQQHMGLNVTPYN